MTSGGLLRSSSAKPIFTGSHYANLSSFKSLLAMGRRSKDEVCVWDFSHIGDIIATYSGVPSLAGVPAGGRVEGKQFEAAVAEAWITFAQEVRSTATIHVVEPARPGQPRVIKFQSNKGP